MEERVNEVRPDFESQVAFVDVDVYDSQNRDFIRAAEVRTIPTTSLVDANGQEQTIIGAIAEEQLREHLRQLVVGFPVESSETDRSHS
jgi:hypothetical protein